MALSPEHLAQLRKNAERAISVNNPYTRAVAYVFADDLIEILDRLHCAEADLIEDEITQPSTPRSKSIRP